MKTQLIKFVADISPRRRFRALLRSVFIVVGVVAAFVGEILLEEHKYWWAALPAVIVLGATLAEFVLGDLLTERRFPSKTASILDNLESKLRNVHDQIRNRIGELIASLPACDRQRVSGTLHLAIELYSPLDEEPEKALVQITDYSGYLGGRRWRFTASTKGLIGRCLRSGKPEYANFADESEYSLRMVREFGFSREEVDRHTKQARSYCAYPIHEADKMIGVLYLFSTEPQVFPRAIDPQKLTNTSNQIVELLQVAHIL